MLAAAEEERVGVCIDPASEAERALLANLLERSLYELAPMLAPHPASRTRDSLGPH